ncbi:MAG: hypothetical protein RL763_376 [Pseudomonadota bacterium]|jgi:hypothetical protein
MNSFFQLFLVWGVLLVFLLVLYVIDKVNVIYQGYSSAEIPATFDDGLFGELAGKTLWDAMSGIPLPGVDAKHVSNLKPHYEPILRQHIEQVFMEGYSHGKAGTVGVPTNNRQIPTPRGSVVSWLPMHHLASLYQAGADFSTSTPDDVLRIQQSLDQVTGMIYARMGLGLGEPYSATLLIHPVSSEADAMLPPAEDAPAAATPAAAVPETPALPAMSMAQSPEPEPLGEVLQPDLSQLNLNRGTQETPEPAALAEAEPSPNEEKAVPVAA